MAAFHHGISAQELTQGILPMRNANVSTLGIVVTSTDADDTMYPLDTPVLLTGITQDNIDKAGEDGTLRNVLQAIRDIHNPTVVVLRVTEPLNVDSLDVLLTCPSRFGLMPKRLGAPEIDTPEVVLKLVSIAKKRRAMVYASPRAEDGTLITVKEDIVAYRDKFAARELMLIEGAFGMPGKSEGLTGDSGISGENYESFDFSIKSDSATAFVTELYVSPVADAAWELKQDGVVIADHTGFLASNVTSTPDEGMEGEMTLAVSAATTDLKEYVLTGVLGHISLMLPESGNGSVVVSRFSQHISDYRLSAHDFNLQVPTSIPSSAKSISFSKSTKFNQDIGMWDTSGLTSMAGMFFGCRSFNQPLDNWDVSNVTNMNFMFAQCSALTSVGLNWDVSKVTSMAGMFYYDASLNCDFTNWNVSSVTNMNEMFYKCSLFDGAISTWTTTNLTKTKSMFAHCAVFNQPLNSWDMSKVTNMEQMFGKCSSFNQDLSSWCVSSIPAKPSGFDDNTPAWTLPKPVWGTCPRG